MYLTTKPSNAVYLTLKQLTISLSYPVFAVLRFYYRTDDKAKQNFIQYLVDGICID